MGRVKRGWACYLHDAGLEYGVEALDGRMFLERAQGWVCAVYNYDKMPLIEVQFAHQHRSFPVSMKMFAYWGYPGCRSANHTEHGHMTQVVARRDVLLGKRGVWFLWCAVSIYMAPKSLFRFSCWPMNRSAGLRLGLLLKGQRA